MYYKKKLRKEVTARIRFTVVDQWIEENTGVKNDFPIMADKLIRTAQELGMIHETKGINTVRCYFIIDDKGILRAIKALQVADNYDVAIPEN